MRRDANRNPVRRRGPPRGRQVLLRAAAALAVLAMGSGPAAATSDPVPIEVTLSSPTTRPILSTDTVEFAAETTDDVFSSSSVGGTSILMVSEESLEIYWEIETTAVPDDVSVLPVLTPLRAEAEVGTLAPGTYQVTVGWEHVGPPRFLADPERDHGTGSFFGSPSVLVGGSERELGHPRGF